MSSSLPPMRRLLPAALLASTALAACGQQRPGASAAAGAQAPGAASVSTPFTAVAAGKVDIEGGLVDVAASRPGIVREVFVQEGDYVKQGDALARQEDVDTRLARDRTAAELAQAEAQVQAIEVDLAIARRESARLSGLSVNDSIARQKLDETRDAVAQAEARLETQKATAAVVRARLAEADYEVDQRTVRAPTDGVIVRRYASPGSGASTLQVTPLFQLQPNLDRIVRAEVDERSLGAVSAGQTVEIVPEADQSKSYPGKVLRVAAVMGQRKLLSDDPSQRTDERVAEVVVDAAQAPILVGQRVLVKFLEPGEKAISEAS